MEDPFEIALVNRKKMLEQIIAEKEAALRVKGPDGHVRCVQRGNRAEYYWRKKSDNTTGIYLSKGSLGTAEFLAQRTYDKAVLRYAREELARVLNLLKHRQVHNMDRIYGSYSQMRQNLVTPIFKTDEQFIEEFRNTVYKGSDFRPGDKMFESQLGEKMRSKSEVLISGIFLDIGAPYLYDYPVNLEEFGTRYADFYVMNVRLRKLYYFEHFGMMDKPDYCAKNLDRILAYQKCGHFPGTDLIITHETDKSPLDLDLVRKIAEHYLL